MLSSIAEIFIDKFEAFDVELACSTADAEIYYTLNGGAETKYTGVAINIATTTELKAWAKKGEDLSSVLTINYKFPEEVQLLKDAGFSAEAILKDEALSVDGKYEDIVRLSIINNK